MAKSTLNFCGWSDAQWALALGDDAITNNLKTIREYIEIKNSYMIKHNLVDPIVEKSTERDTRTYNWDSVDNLIKLLKHRFQLKEE